MPVFIILCPISVLLQNHLYAENINIILFKQYCENIDIKISLSIASRSDLRDRSSATNSYEKLRICKMYWVFLPS